MSNSNTPSSTVTPAELTERYHSILNAMIEGVQIIDFDHRYLYVNDAAVKQNKQSRAEVIGHTQMERYPGIEKTEVFAKMHQCAVEHVPTYIENEFEFPDGSKGWYEVRSEPLPFGVLVLSLDITDRKRASEDLQKQTIETVQAKARVEEAEKLNAIITDREIVMIDLKNKIKQLEKEISELRAKVDGTP